MARTQRYLVDGLPVIFTAGMARYSIDGITIPFDAPKDALENPDYIRVLKTSRELFQDFCDFSEAVSRHQVYIPSNREIPSGLETLRREFTENLVAESTIIRERWIARKASSFKSPEQGAIAGYVYLVEAIEPLKHYKIGLSKTPIKRVNTLGVQLPYPIQLIHLIKSNDIYWAESVLHKAYEGKRVNGEWFALTAEEVKEIRTITELNNSEVE